MGTRAGTSSRDHLLRPYHRRRWRGRPRRRRIRIEQIPEHSLEAFPLKSEVGTDGSKASSRPSLSQRISRSR